MSLYRGAGGASDATDDSTVNAVAGYASSAASSASAASTSASNASTSASAAATSASQAASSVSTAASHASNASTSASNASTSASSASSSASSASTSATNASNSAGSASTYASEALGYRNTASTHATNAANSASAAAGSATSASNSAASALAIYGNTVAMEAAVDDAQEAALTATQESQAASDSAIASAESEELAYEHEQNAAEWATVAQGAANSSVAAAGAANLAWDQFDDRYLGAKTVDPALDNDNNPLVTGALYFNSATGSMKVYTGTNWTDAYTTNNGFLLANNNLSDIQSDATARDNLGLGSIATQDYDTITITGGSITGITDLAINDGGTGASTAAGARSNLGLGSSAVLNAGVPGGVATLDGGGAVPTSQLPAAVLGAVKYQGVWNASSNSPAITSSTGTQGHYYVVFTAGSTSIDGISDWKVGDWIIYNGAVWQKIDNTDLVSSVNGYTGTINLAYSDVGAPSTSGTNATGTWGIDVTGNAATVTNGVYTTGSYANPTWISSIAGSKVTGDISGNAGSVTNGVYTTGDQTIGGNKTFSNTISGSIDGNANTATSATSATTATNVSGGTASVTTLTTSSTVTLNGGTANGVSYLNASKMLTTGSALTFDGAILGVNGVSVGRGAGAVGTNTAVGASALASASQTGTYNAAGGYRAFEANTSGSYNTAFGSQAAITNTTGSGLAAFGYNSLVFNTTGSYNTGIGQEALRSNTTASNNTAVGYQAGYANTTGVNLTAVGSGALMDNTTGGGNVAMGHNSLGNNTTGGGNAAFGGQWNGVTNATLFQNTTGSYNTAVGVGALSENTTGNSNTAVGYLAGFSSTGASHTLVGWQAGYSLTTAIQNTLVGIHAGGSLTTGSRNTFVGVSNNNTGECGSLVTTGSANTIIGGYTGNQGGLDIHTASNYIVLSDGDGNPVMISTGNGSVSSNHTSASGNSEFCLMRAAVKKWFIWNDGNTDRFNITPASFSSGVYLTNTATAWAAYSDRRIKSDIVDIEYGLATVMAMQPRRYTVTANGKNSIGFIAQELKEVLPEAVVGEEIEFSNDDTPQERSAKTMGVAKDNIIPVLVKAIQELKSELDSVKAELAVLKGN